MPDHRDPLEAETQNAFTPAFLGHLGDLDEPDTAFEASTAGPWSVREDRGAFLVLRHWETPELGDLPRATFARRETALLAAASLTAMARAGDLALTAERSAAGFTVQRCRREEGQLSVYDPHLLDAIGLLEGLVRCPEALAAVLEAAGATALEAAGRIASRTLGAG